MSARRQEEKWATNYLRRLESSFGGQLDPASFRKIVNSYSIYIPMICDAFMGLRGRKTSAQEKERMLLYFICSTIFDDFCDRKELSRELLYRISYESEQYQPTRVEERLFLHAHLALKGFVADQSLYEEITRELFRVQVDSDKQFDPAISQEELTRITLGKGGYSVLLCHFYFDSPACAIEQACWYRLGGIIQLTNDLFDIYKDLEQGSVTLPNRMESAYEFSDYFMGEVTAIEKAIAMLPYDTSRRQDFLSGVMGICSFGSLALHRLRELQGQEERLPNLRQLPRKALVVDMEQATNIWYCIKFTYRKTKAWQLSIVAAN
ncbi:class 1 isoprenoid biosynthesis enzyme [Chitinophaga eiseniae]|uniref:Class 1 isoprenoid biosynthesis enzyme n=1 Tax=Chitinophaga eiseniae TaxID=634771 RepID=A0A847SEM2_9BACT|nr:class 1 isoprenoid biosynthesis enzyme [Chitinophaga eiseniae]NLR77405.1 class 1 isoprenoid biosynthesis enzyme [Chitinophaga eiseniae]